MIEPQNGTRLKSYHYIAVNAIFSICSVVVNGVYNYFS